MKTAIGIDLGSTNSCVTAYVNNKIEAIFNEEGDYITESRVFFSDKDDDIIVGKIAKDNNYPYNEIYDVKHFMGKKFDDVEDKMKKTYPFQLVKGKDDNVEIAIKNNFQYIYKTPEEISAKILEKLIKGASNRLQDDFNKEAVITVPVYFNTEQRAATKRAAEIAGLKVIGLLNEPTAAAIYYFQLNRNKSFKKNVVVYDFGGATFNISIIEMSNKKIKIKYVGSDTQLGGKNIDDRIFQKIKNLLRQKHGIKIDNKTTKAKELLIRCEEVKKQLSVRKSANIISNYSDAQGNPITFDLKREEFEQMNMDLFNKTIDILKSCLNEAKFKPEDIDDVLLVGGSSRIPKIQDFLENLFGSNKLGKECSIDEAVAMGAAFQANLLTKSPKNAIEDLIILPDVLSGSLGTDIEGGKMSVIIKNDTPLPVENTRRYKTVNDNQSSMLIRIFQGNNEDIAENEFVDEMCIDDLTRAPKGEVKIDVKFSVDPNGVLKVTATGKMSGIVKQLTVSLKKGNL